MAYGTLKVDTITSDNGSDLDLQVNGSTKASIDGTTGFLDVGVSNNIVGSDGTADATAGNVGEVIEHLNTSVSITTSIAELATISLTAGDWDVTGIVHYSGAVANTIDMMIGTTTASATGTTVGDTRLKFALYNTGGVGAGIIHTRIRISSADVYYLNGLVNTGAGSSTNNCTLRARRIR